MIRKATFDDIESIEDTYNEHFKYENENGAFTVFKKGIYPTGKDAEKAVSAGTLFVQAWQGKGLHHLLSGMLWSWQGIIHVKC